MINIQKVIAIILLTGQVIMSQNLKELVSQFREAEAPDDRGLRGRRPRPPAGGRGHVARLVRAAGLRTER